MRGRVSAVVLLALSVATAGGPTVAVGQVAPQSWSGVPQQVNPLFPEVGAPTFTTPTGSATNVGFNGGAVSGGTASGNGPTSGATAPLLQSEAVVPSPTRTPTAPRPHSAAVAQLGATTIPETSNTVPSHRQPVRSGKTTGLRCFPTLRPAPQRLRLCSRRHVISPSASTTRLRVMHHLLRTTPPPISRRSRTLWAFPARRHLVR